MKKIIGIIVGGVILVFLVLGILRSRQSEEVQSIAKIQQREGIPVVSYQVTRGEVQNVHEYYGTVQARQQAVVTSRLMERIERIYVEEGDHVRKNQVLVQFDTTASQAAVAQARLQFNNARRDFQRMKRLYEEGAISKQNLDHARMAYEVAEENYQTALRSVELVAPIAGVVVSVVPEEGDLVNPGEVVVQIVGEGDYEVVFSVTQDDRNLLNPGQKVNIRLNGDKPVVGELRKISLAANDVTRLFTAHATMPVTEGVYPGVMVTVDVVVNQRDSVITVPNNAVVDRGEGTFVYVIKRDTLAIQRPVRIGLQGELVMEVLEGLNEGQTIVEYGHNALEDSAKVKIVQQREELIGSAD